MNKIHKYKNWEEVPDNQLGFWLEKTLAERLEASKELMKRARQIFLANPLNQLKDNGRRISKFRSIAKRT